MSNIAAESNATVTWSTWEELLLAFAVKRYGFKDWDTVAKELQSRSNHGSGALVTAEICREKYLNLRKRFVNRQNNHKRSAATGGGDGNGERKDLTCSGESDGDDNNDVIESDDDGSGGGEGGESFSWLEDLRKLRVAELKMEVQRYDISIKSLEMKVKTMEEEKDKSLDLDGEMKGSGNDKNNDGKGTSGIAAGNSVTGEENRSFNESNSTENTRTGLTKEPEPVEVKPNYKILKPVGEEDSCNDSTDRKTSHEREKDGVDSVELLHSSSELREESQGTKGSSDVQSSASLMKTKRNKRINKVGKVGSGGGGGGETGVASPATVSGAGVGVKSEASLGVLDIIRLHKHGSVFHRRLQSQKSGRYKNMIRQHVDLEKVQSRLENGSYSSCPAKIYVDLLLLFNNAIVFFPKSSSESRVAHELRQLVMKHLKKYSNSAGSHPSPQDPLLQPESQRERSDPLLVNQKSTAPIVVCKKINKVEKHGQDKTHSGLKPLSTSNKEDVATKSKAVTGVRSARKSINGRSNINNSQTANPKPSSSSQQRETFKVVNEKKAEVTTIDKKKGAADFLKRIKKNDSPKGILAEGLKTSGESIRGSSSSKKDHHPIKKLDDKNEVGRSGSRSGGGRGGGGTKRLKEESSPLRRNVGRPPKKGKEVLKGKRGRDESEEEEGSSKRLIKRSRR